MVYLVNIIGKSDGVQAWVIFRDLNSAVNALKGKQGFQFYDKPLVRTFLVLF